MVVWTIRDIVNVCALAIAMLGAMIILLLLLVEWVIGRIKEWFRKEVKDGER